jgi:pyruvate, water dikinase
MATFIRWFDEISLDGVPRAGGKASLGEMYRELCSLGVKVPNGFAITVDVYWAVIDGAGLADRPKRDGVRRSRGSRRDGRVAGTARA